MEPSYPKAAALRFAAYVAEYHSQSYAPRDVFSTHSQWNTIKEDKIEQRSISRQSTITRAVQHFYSTI